MPDTTRRNNVPAPGARRPTTTQPTRLRAAADRAQRAARTRPRRTAAAATALALVLSALGYLVWPASQHRYDPAIRGRTYASYTACLLTDQTGITGTAAAPVWAGMQAASHTTTEQVSYLTMQGDNTATAADTYINTLAQRGCDLILTAGPLPDKGVTDRAPAYPNLHFITVTANADGADTGSAAPPNPTITGSDTTPPPAGTPGTPPANITSIAATSATAIQTGVTKTLITAYRKTNP